MREFQHTQTITATRERIWAIWADVANWHLWDSEVEQAQLTEPFAEGAKGIIKPKVVSARHFTITKLTEGQRFTYVVGVPLGKLNVAHYFDESDTTTVVRRVWFDGLLGGFYGRVLGEAYAEALPTVLERLKAIAES